jgi:hypothetical protein
MTWLAAGGERMIDNFALGLTHALMLFAAWRLLRRADLDDASVPVPAAPEAKARRPFGKAAPGA